jgi:taurine dioxygenase
MNFDVVPLSNALGVEVRGLDLREPLAPGVAAALAKVWHDNVALLFRDQDLDEAAQLRFAGQFGQVGQRARPPERRPEGADYNASIMLISNIRRNGVPIGSLPDGEMWFHHDMCYTAAPHKGTMLYAIEIPSTGGNTLFANMYRAYDGLAPSIKARIAGRKALQIYDFGTTGRVDADGDLSKYPHYWQPIAITHPISGRKALYVNPLITAKIEGLSREESDALLEELFEFQNRREIIYEHAWRPGDLLMWDNWCSCHARTDFPAEERRLLRRCTLLGQPLSE